jgi:hypothetical protein
MNLSYTHLASFPKKYQEGGKKPTWTLGFIYASFLFSRLFTGLGFLLDYIWGSVAMFTEQSSSREKQASEIWTHVHPPSLLRTSSRQDIPKQPGLGGELEAEEQLIKSAPANCLDHVNSTIFTYL